LRISVSAGSGNDDKKGGPRKKKGRFTEEQIIGVLKQHEAGRKIPELAREIGVSEATIYTGNRNTVGWT
jgi:hypothetical protein